MIVDVTPQNDDRFIDCWSTQRFHIHLKKYQAGLKLKKNEMKPFSNKTKIT